MNRYLVTYRTDAGYQQVWVDADGWLRGDKLFKFERWLKHGEVVVFSLPTKIVRSVALELGEQDAFVEEHRGGDVPWPLSEGPRVIYDAWTDPPAQGKSCSCIRCGRRDELQLLGGGNGPKLSLLIFACDDCRGFVEEAAKKFLREEQVP